MPISYKLSQDKCLASANKRKWFGRSVVTNYDRYHMATYSKEAKLKWREEHFEKDLQHAFDAGKRMALQILSE